MCFRPLPHGVAAGAPVAVHAAGWGRLKLGGFQPAPQWVDGTAALSLWPSAPHARHPCHHGGVHGRGTVSRHSLRAFSESRCRGGGRGKRHVRRSVQKGLRRHLCQHLEDVPSGGAFSPDRLGRGRETLGSVEAVMTLLTGQAGCWGQGSDPQGRGEARGRGRSGGVTRRPRPAPALPRRFPWIPAGRPDSVWQGTRCGMVGRAQPLTTALPAAGNRL